MTITNYERAIAETWTTAEGKDVLRLRLVDGAAILNEDGQRLPCWNGLSPRQQRDLIEHGGRVREAEGDIAGACDQPASVMVEAPNDEDAPGPRFYCYACTALYAAGLYKAHKEER